MDCNTIHAAFLEVMPLGNASIVDSLPSLSFLSNDWIEQPRLQKWEMTRAS
jgi:hypothetical protein